jgi:hypothetical protein
MGLASGKKIIIFFLPALALAARADNSAADRGAPWPVTVDMPRSTAMGGANSAIATGNDALAVNPAGAAASRRYHFEVDGVYDSSFPAQGVMVSIVDSATTPVASGMLFSRWGSGRGDGRGEGWLLGFTYAHAVGQNLFFGGQTKFTHFHSPPDGGLTARWAQDIGFLSRGGGGFSWAAVLQNISLEKIPLFPLTATAGLAWGSDTDWHLAFDYKADLSDTKDIKHRAALGAELLLEQSIALRGGATWDPAASMWWISAGVGLLTDKAGLQLVWRRRVSGGYDQLFEAGVTLFLE